MTHEDQLLDKAINIYLTGLKGIESFISEPASEYNLSFEQFLILRKIINHPNIKLMDVGRGHITRCAAALAGERRVEGYREEAAGSKTYELSTNGYINEFPKGTTTYARRHRSGDRPVFRRPGHAGRPDGHGGDHGDLVFAVRGDL